MVNGSADHAYFMSLTYLKSSRYVHASTSGGDVRMCVHVYCDTCRG